MRTALYASLSIALACTLSACGGGGDSETSLQLLAEGDNAAYDIHDLGGLGGYTSDAWAISNSGHVVGYARDQNSLRRAVLFDTSGGSNLNLGDLGAGGI